MAGEGDSLADRKLGFWRQDRINRHLFGIVGKQLILYLPQQYKRCDTERLFPRDYSVGEQGDVAQVLAVDKPCGQLRSEGLEFDSRPVVSVSLVVKVHKRGSGRSGVLPRFWVNQLDPDERLDLRADEELNPSDHRGGGDRTHAPQGGLIRVPPRR